MIRLPLLTRRGLMRTGMAFGAASLLPRAGWSAAMIIIVPSVSATVRRERVAARRAKRPGSSIRTRVTSS